ncbi:MAG: hypothetical protein ACR2QC_08060 [Gammaproteobacteria bacterium]
MENFELQLVSTDDLIEELKSRCEGYALVMSRRWESEARCVATYYHHGGFFLGYGLAVSMVDWFKDERRPMSDAEVEELDDL